MKKVRNVNIDLIKCIAVFSVISVHFFLNNGFYDKIITSNLHIAVFFRTMFMICVPLFLITTGYLMKNKEPSKKYYFGILRVLLTYILSTILILLYKKFYLNEIYTFKSIIKNILSFDVGYCWYIEMYIGLFLLIPFLNIMYNNIKEKRIKRLLILTMIILTSLPGILNFKYHLIPDWWTNVYPITYYFIGAYIKEYKININKILNIGLFILSVAISVVLNILISKNNPFVWGIHNDWSSIFILIPTVLIFILINNLKLDSINIRIKRIITKVSELSLGIYLLSNITDNYLYNHLFYGNNLLTIKSYFKLVFLSFVLATGLSIIVNAIYNIVDKFVLKRIRNYH